METNTHCNICKGLMAPDFHSKLPIAHELCKARLKLGKPIEQIDYIAPSKEWVDQSCVKAIRALNDFNDYITRR